MLIEKRTFGWVVFREGSEYTYAIPCETFVVY